MLDAVAEAELGVLLLRMINTPQLAMAVEELRCNEANAIIRAGAACQ
jgi:hypothetical protein